LTEALTDSIARLREGIDVPARVASRIADIIERELAPSSSASTNNALAPGERKPGEIAGPRNDDAPLARDARTLDRASQEQAQPAEGTLHASASHATTRFLAVAYCHVDGSIKWEPDHELGGKMLYIVADRGCEGTPIAASATTTSDREQRRIDDAVDGDCS
jgi:hypothetical protein